MTQFSCGADNKDLIDFHFLSIYIRAMKRVLIAVLACLSIVAASAQASSLSPIKHVRAAGIDIGYRDIGSGRPLFLIMGYTGTMAAWDPAFLAKLGKKFHVYVFDNRGVATTSRGVGDLTVSVMADDTSALITALGYKRVSVLGWSMGGFIAQELALRRPNKVDHLIFAATNPGSPKTVGPTKKALEVFRDPNVSPLKLIDILFPENKRAAESAYIKRILNQPGLVADSFKTSPEILKDQTRAIGEPWLGTNHGTYDRLTRIKRPTFVAGAANDEIVPAKNSRLIADRIADAKLTIYPNSGHAFLFQLREQFSNDVILFLRK